MNTGIIIRPVITEKSMREASLGKFTFQVAKEADKTTIRKAVEEKFKVSVLSITTSVIKGKTRRFGKRMKEAVLSSWKKAVVELKKGQKIDLFEVPSQS